MEWLIILFLVFIILLVLASFIYSAWRLSAMMLSVAKVAQDFTGSAEKDPICTKTEEHMDTFLTDRFTPELAVDMEKLADDIEYDPTELTDKKISTMKQSAQDLITSKLILDTMLHFYIYNKLPNTISHKALDENIAKIEKLLKTNDRICFSAEKVRNILPVVMSSLSAGKKDEKKMDHLSLREYFRKVKISLLTSGADNLKVTGNDESDRLKDELSRKNVELRQCNESLEREHNRTTVTTPFSSRGFGSLSAEMLLEDCNKERRALQEKIYDLRKDIELVRTRGIGSNVSETELATLRSRIEDLRTRNSQLETQLRSAENSHAAENNQISSLSNELSNCRKLLDEVLNAA